MAISRREMLIGTGGLVAASVAGRAVSALNSAENRATATAKPLIVLVAGPSKFYKPGQHDYMKAARLLKVLLDRAPGSGRVQTEICGSGWADDPSILDRASTIVFLTDGDDWPKEVHAPFLKEDGVRILEKQMTRGCGIVTFHFSTFAEGAYSADMLDWVGGFFDLESGPADATPPHWHSVNKFTTTEVTLATPTHPISAGVKPFVVKDEFCFRLAFKKDAGWTPILKAPELAPDANDQVVAWAYQRRDGGRGFGFTLGHYYDNWSNDDFRKSVLNGVVWSAGITVPPGGVESHFVSDAEVDDGFS